MKFRPLHDRVMIRRIDPEGKTTGGIIMGGEGIQAAYATGKGRVVMRAKAYIEESKAGRYSIIVTELPFQVNKSSLVEKIADLKNARLFRGQFGPGSWTGLGPGDVPLFPRDISTQEIYAFDLQLP